MFRIICLVLLYFMYELKKILGGWGLIDIYVCWGMYFWEYLKMLFFKNNFLGGECFLNFF